MKKLIFSFLLIFVMNRLSISQTTINHLIGDAEILIRNYSAIGHDIKINVIPVGVVFSGFIISPQNLNNKYSFERSNQSGEPHWTVNPDDNLKYIVGGSKTLQFAEFGYVDFDDQGYYNHIDSAINNTRVIGGVSFGLWKFEFYDSETDDLIDECYIDYRDFNLGVPGAYSTSPDIILDIVRKPNSTRDSLEFCFISAYDLPHINIQDSRIINKTIKLWERIGTSDPTIHAGFPNRGLFKSSSEFLNYPLNANQYGGVNHINPGLMSLNLEIQNNDIAKINSSIPLIVDDSTKLMLKYSDTYANNARLYVQGSGKLIIKPTATLDIDKYGNVIIENGGRTVLEQNSNVFFHDRGEIIVKSGGSLINCGANFTNNNYACILVESGGYYGPGQECNLSTTHTVNNGAFIVINGGDLTIGDSSKIIFDGANSFLKINPNSTIKLGKDASIEFKNGA